VAAHAVEIGAQALAETVGFVGGRRLGPTGPCPWSDTARTWVLAFGASAGMPVGLRMVTGGAWKSDHSTRTRPTTPVRAVARDTGSPVKGGDSASVGWRSANCVGYPGLELPAMAIQHRPVAAEWNAGFPPSVKHGWGGRVERGESPRAWEWSVVRDVRDNKSAAQDWVEASFPVHRHYIVEPESGGIAGLEGTGNLDQAGVEGHVKRVLGPFAEGRSRSPWRSTSSQGEVEPVAGILGRTTRVL
jgi:hypothetical protein